MISIHIIIIEVSKYGGKPYIPSLVITPPPKRSVPNDWHTLYNNGYIQRVEYLRGRRGKGRGLGIEFAN